MATHTTGITAVGTNHAASDMAEVSTASQTAADVSASTDATRQDWLEILLSVATERLGIPVARLRLKDGTTVHALILHGVMRDEDGGLIFK